LVYASAWSRSIALAWYAEGEEYIKSLAEDRSIRSMVYRSLPEAAVLEDRDRALSAQQIRLTVHSAEARHYHRAQRCYRQCMRSDLQKLTDKRVKLDISEIEHPENRRLPGGPQHR